MEENGVSTYPNVHAVIPGTSKGRHRFPQWTVYPYGTSKGAALSKHHSVSWIDSCKLDARTHIAANLVIDCRPLLSPNYTRRIGRELHNCGLLCREQGFVMLVGIEDQGPSSNHHLKYHVLRCLVNTGIHGTGP